MKYIKKLIITLLIGFVFLGAGLKVLAATGYIQWGGTGDKEHMLVTFTEVKKNITALKSDRDSNKQVVNDLKQNINDLKQTVKDKEQIVKDKEQAIKDKQQEVNDKQKEVAEKQKEIAEKQKEIDEIRKNHTANSEQLKQAEADIKMLDKEADKLLEASK